MAKKPRLADSDLSSCSKVRIMNSYDSLINYIDVRAEETLAKYSSSNMLADFCKNLKPNPPNSLIEESYKKKTNLFEVLQKPFVDPYTTEYDLDKKYKLSLVDPEKTTVQDYINKMRDEMINELRRLERSKPSN